MQEGQDPLPVLSRMISTHSQIVTGGEVISDSQLAYLWASNPITSTAVMSTVNGIGISTTTAPNCAGFKGLLGNNNNNNRGRAVGAVIEEGATGAV